MSGNNNFLGTFAAIRWANWLEQRREQKEREALLNTIALVEEELAKPEYFGYLVEKDRVGYLEALSKTKTTFRGLNPHDSLNGMVANGELNSDFVMMLEENFFRVNNKNIDRDDLFLIRYEIERNKMIEWLKQEFQAFSIDDAYFMKKAGISQEELFQRLQNNEWVWGIDANNGSLSILDQKQYLEGLQNKKLLETFPSNFCTQENIQTITIDLHNIFEEQKKIGLENGIKQNQKENSVVMLTMAITCVIVAIVVYFFLKMGS